MHVSNRLKCCCNVVDTYWLLQPCFNVEPAEIVYMSSADFASCGFSLNTIYSWDSISPFDDPYCGFWVFNKTVAGDRLDNDCGSYIVNAEGCCGGDCFPDESCCGFNQCFDWYQTNALGLIEVTAFGSGTGSTTGWSVAVTNVGVSSWYWAGGQFKYDVTVSIAITVTGIGSLTCDGNSSFTSAGSFSFTVSHDKSLGCLSTSLSGVTYPDPNCGIRVCTGTTSDGSTSTSDCSRVAATLGTPSASTPDLGRDCELQSSYSLTVPIDYQLTAGDLNICLDCTSNGRWANDAFPYLSVSTTLTLSGTWAP